MRRTSLLMPWTWRLASALTAIALAAVLMTGCEVAEPKLPVFTTELAVPLGYERLEIADIVDDEDYLVAMADGQLGFQVVGDPDTVALDFDLTANVPGRYTAPASRAYLYYTAENKTWAAPLKVQISR